MTYQTPSEVKKSGKRQVYPKHFKSSCDISERVPVGNKKQNSRNYQDGRIKKLKKDRPINLNL